MKKPNVVFDYLAVIGKRGGQSRSKDKVEAARKNAEIARAARKNGKAKR